MRGKYGNMRTVVDGFEFQSKAEAARYSQLKLLQKTGHIRGLELQPAFPVVIGGKKVCTYRADFAYFDREERVVEDVKGCKTPLYKLKKKLVEALYPGVVIREVQA